MERCSKQPLLESADNCLELIRLTRVDGDLSATFEEFRIRIHQIDKLMI